MSTWTKEETSEFIKLYKSYRHLWDKSSNLYQHKQAREAALLSIMTIMGPDKFVSFQDVKVKIKNLRTTYHQVLKKIARSERQGIPYQPTLSWFNEFEEIMEADKLEPVKQEPDSDDSDEIVLEYSEPTSVNNPITSVYIETMPDEEDTPYVESHLTSQPTINVAPIPVKRIKLEELDEDNAGPSHDMTGQRKETVNDEFQMFADNIAEQLRKLPLDRALKIQLEIQTMVAKERTQFYRKSIRTAQNN